MRFVPWEHEYYGLSESEAGRPAVTLATVTVWPEWGPTFMPPLDKGTENRPGKPPKTVLGKRVAVHNGTYLGGRKGKKARAEGFAAVLSAAEMSGWRVAEACHSQVPTFHFESDADILYADRDSRLQAPAIWVRRPFPPGSVVSRTFRFVATGKVFEAGPGVKFLGLVRLSEELFHVFEVTP